MRSRRTDLIALYIASAIMTISALVLLATSTTFTPGDLVAVGGMLLYGIAMMVVCICLYFTRGSNTDV